MQEEGSPISDQGISDLKREAQIAAEFARGWRIENGGWR
jgi:hypothetical protein